jgi:hypothetical protein
MKNQRLRRNRALGIMSAFPVDARHGFELIYSENSMKKVREITESEEPIGIIISRGDRTEARPIFSAYIWGPAPEPVPDATTKVA